MAVSAITLSGCAANPFADRVNQHQAPGHDIVSRNPELDAIIIAHPADGHRLCMSPETDAVPTQSVGFALSYAGSQGGANEGAGAGELGGRSPGVLITREILYRTCEFTLNHDLSDADALSLFRDALTQIAAITAAESETGSAPQTAAPPSLPAN